MKYDKAFKEQVVLRILAKETTITKEAEEIFRSQCGNIQWELSTFHFFHIYSLAYRGEMVELQQRVPRLLREAEDRGERYGQVTHRAALANMVWLCKDDVDEARHKVREIMREGHSGYHVEHFWALIAECQAALDQLFLDGKIHPRVARTYALSELPQALRDMANRKVIGKTVVVP